MRPYVICHMAISIDGKVTGSLCFRIDFKIEKK